MIKICKVCKDEFETKNRKKSMRNNYVTCSKKCETMYKKAFQQAYDQSIEELSNIVFKITRINP